MKHRGIVWESNIVRSNRACSCGTVDDLHDIIRPVKYGEQTPDFELPDLHGQLHRLGDFRGHIVVINFWSAQCPHVERTDALISAWREEWGADAVLLSIASNRNESTEAIAEAAQRRRLPLLLIDANHKVADAYAAQTTPEVFVIDREGRLRYSGAMDDATFARRVPTRFFVDEAVRALLAGDSPPVSRTRPYGCAIIREALE